MTATFVAEPTPPVSPPRWVRSVLWNSTHTTFFGILDEAKRVNWRDPANQIGGGSLAIHRDAAHANQITGGRIVETQVWDPDLETYVAAYQWRVENKPDTVIAPTPSAKVLTPAGRGVEQDWEVSQVDPHGGVNTVPWGDVRNFGWQAPELPDDDWIAPNVRATQAQRSSIVPQGLGGQPYTWPVPLSKWISGQAPTGNSDPIGFTYYRYHFETFIPLQVTIYVAADNLFVCALNGVEIMEEQTVSESAFDDSYYRRLRLPAGEHVLCVRVENLSQTEIFEDAIEDLNPSLLNVAVFADIQAVPAQPFLGDPDDWGVPNLTQTRIVLFATGPSGGYDLDTLPAPWQNIDYAGADFGNWLTLPYPTTAPGMTPGRILKLLYDEAVARGELLNWDISFTSFRDSNNVLWPDEIPDFNVRVGATYIEVLSMLVEQGYIQWAVSPDSLTMNVWIAGTVMNVQSAVFEEGNIRTLTHTDKWGIGRTKMMARTKDGWVRRGTGHRQGVVSIPDMEKARVSNFLQQQIDRSNNDASSMRFDYVAVDYDLVPYTGFRNFDTVTAPDDTNQPIVEQVLGIEVTENTVGPPNTTVTMLSMPQIAEAALVKVQDRMSPGSLNGRVASIAPSTKLQPQGNILSTVEISFVLPDSATNAAENAISNGLAYADSNEDLPPFRIKVQRALLTCTGPQEGEGAPTGDTIVDVYVNTKRHMRFILTDSEYEVDDYDGSGQVWTGMTLPNAWCEYGPKDKIQVQLADAGDHRGLKLTLFASEIPG